MELWHACEKAHLRICAITAPRWHWRLLYRGVQEEHISRKKPTFIATTAHNEFCEDRANTCSVFQFALGQSFGSYHLHLFWGCLECPGGHMRGASFQCQLTNYSREFWQRNDLYNEGIIGLYCERCSVQHLQRSGLYNKRFRGRLALRYEGCTWGA